jgi:hypothetical protein
MFFLDLIQDLKTSITRAELEREITLKKIDFLAGKFESEKSLKDQIEDLREKLFE